MKTRTKQKSKQTEERFEKVVIGGESLGLSIFGLISVIIPSLFFLAYVNEFYQVSNFGFAIITVLIVIWFALALSNFFGREVYWRKIK